MNLLNSLSLSIFIVAFCFASCQTPNTIEIQNKKIDTAWEIQSSADVTVADSLVSQSGFEHQNWYEATVPGSVLGSLVADSVFNNIFFHRNLEKIPDSLFNVPWWYRTTFNIAHPDTAQTYRLRFDGISYRADIWLNGEKIASSDTLKGSFRQFVINISPFVKDGKNVLALKVTHAKAGELGIGFVDWNPEPVDHNMGIWREVHLEITGPVSLNHPFVQTKVDTATLDHAQLTISAKVQNHSSKVVHGEVKGNIGGNLSFSKKVTLQPRETKQIVFSPQDFAQLNIDHPKLWWVHTLGEPNLYHLQLEFETNGNISDSKDVSFGIRQVSDYVTADGQRGFKLNGKKILIKGGGWTDPMLLNATPEYEQAGIDYAVQMNLNTIRMEGFWGNNQHLYNLCDKKGILIMVGFSCQWEWANLMDVEDDKHGTIMSPEKMKLAAESWQDQIVWLRNHPSIFLWLYGSDKWPRPELERKYLDILKKYDPTRPSVASAKEHTSVITGPTNMKMRGPYDYVPPVYWYVDSTHGGAFGFNTETGPGPQIPVLESLKKMIPEDSLWPISDAWLYHAARGNFHNFTAYNNAMEKRLGKPEDLQDYLRKAQYLNYEGMRAMFEAFEANRFKATGIIQWMYNSSWPKLWWQLYDYYLMPTGAFYGARKANEPIHISYNYGKRAVNVMNNTAEDSSSRSAEIKVLDFHLNPVLEKTIAVNELPALETQKIFQLPANLPLSKTWFLDLKLYDAQQHLVSSNFYVLSTQKDQLEESESTWYITPQTQYADLTMLQQLPKVKLEVQKSTEQKGDTTFVYVKVKNPSDHLAFMVHLNLKKGSSNESVVPVFWEENYITLLPGEERTVSVFCHTKDLEGKEPEVTVDGWNIE